MSACISIQQPKLPQNHYSLDIEKNYDLSVIPPKKERIIFKIARYAGEFFKIIPVVVNWIVIADVKIPPIFPAIAAVLSILMASYNLVRDIMACKEAKTPRELVICLLDLLGNLLYFSIALLTIPALGFSVAPWIIALLGTIAMLLSLANFIFKEIETPHTKLELKIPDNISSEKVEKIRQKIEKTLKAPDSPQASELEAPKKNPLRRSASWPLLEKPALN